MVKLSREAQREFVREHPILFEPVNGAWGRQGCTQVRLPFGGRGGKGETDVVRRAVKAAWVGARQAKRK